MDFKKIFYVCLYFVTIIHSSIWSMQRASKINLAQYLPQSMQTEPTTLTAQQLIPEITVNPDLYQQVQAEVMPSRKSMWASSGTGAFKFTRPNLFKATTPRLMSRSEALQTLGLSDGATDQDIKKAYRTAAMKSHPDAGGSTAAMQKVNDAKDVLNRKTEEKDPLRSWAKAWEKGMDEAREELKEPPIMQAVRLKDPQERLAAVKKLIREGADLNAIQKDHATALGEAVFVFNDADVVDALLEAGAFQTSIFGTPLLHEAVKHNNPRIIKSLISHGADANEVDNKYLEIRTPMNIALEYAGPEALTALIKGSGTNKVNPNLKIYHTFYKYDSKAGSIKVTERDTPLNIVVSPSYKRKGVLDNKVTMVDALLNAGADPNIAGTNYPLHSAIISEYYLDQNVVDIVKALLDKGANPNIRDKDGKTPLDNLSNCFDREVCAQIEKILRNAGGLSSEEFKDVNATRAMLASKADLNIKDEFGKTPLDRMKKHTGPEAEKLKEALRKAGALTRDELGQRELDAILNRYSK